MRLRLFAACLALVACVPPPPAPPAPPPSPAAPAAPPPAEAISDPARLESVARPGAKPISIEHFFQSTQVASAAPSPDGRRVVYVSNKSGRYNLWIAEVDHAGTYPITASDERQMVPVFSPDGEWIAFQSDHQGDERWDLFVAHADGTHLDNLTRTPDISESFPRFSPDGRHLAYLHRHKDAAAGEIALIDLATRKVRMITQGTRAGLDNDHPIFSHDGKLLASTEWTSSGDDAHVHVVDLASGKDRVVTPHQGKHGYEAADFSPDGRSLLIGTNEKGGIDGVAILDLETLALDHVVHDAWSSEPGSFSPDGKYVTFTHNVDGSAELSIFDLATRKTRTLSVSRGLSSNVRDAFSRDGGRLFFMHDAPDAPRAVWVHETATGRSRPLTRALPDGVDSRALVEPQLVHYPSTDGRYTISAFVYVPHNQPRDGHGAGVVMVHGGPTGQFLNNFNRTVQLLVSRGYVVIAPNFRGSSGYGEAFQFANKLDWGGGDLADVREAATWIARSGFVDAKKIAIMGGSYGGYMTMMGLTKQPDAWAAGVSIVPFVNLFTEFEREDPNLREYDRQFMGDPEKNRELWMDARW